MPAVPARTNWKFEVQDNRGFKASVSFIGFIADLSTAAATLATQQAAVAALGTALQAATNAKVVSTGFGFEFFIAQEPSTETGTYQLVNQKAHLLFGDGNGLKESVSIPAPKDGLFLTSSQDDLIVVNPASTLLTAIQTATANIGSPSGGVYGSQFFGGQLRAQKPRRRRVLQGA